MTQISDYEFQTADLLHDPNNVQWSTTQLDNYINRARIQLVRDTGVLRSLQASYITPATEQYTFGQVTGAVISNAGSGYTSPTVSFSGGGGSGVAATLTQSGGLVNSITFTSFGSGYTSAPTATVSDGGPGTGATIAVGILNVNTYDILTINLQWGNQRYQLLWRVWSEFSAIFRGYTETTYTRQPVGWSAYGDTGIFIGPPPDQSYPVEFDSVILPAAISGSTVDPIPVIVQDPIPFYAAYLAKLNSQSYGEAESHKSTYTQKMLECSSIYQRRIPSAYDQN